MPLRAPWCGRCSDAAHHSPPEAAWPGSAWAPAVPSFWAGSLYRISALEPTLHAGPLLLVAVTLVASFLPVRSATRVDPIRGLRVD